MREIRNYLFQYCKKRADEMQEAADYCYKNRPEYGPLGFSRGDLAQGISDFWRIMEDAFDCRKGEGLGQ